MKKIKDLTGQKFNKLTVIKMAPRTAGKKILWVCECDCANKTHVLVNRSNLIRNLQKSCGCLRKTQNELLAGKTFGKLLVLNINTKTKKDAMGSTFWDCKCECGKIISLPTYLLTRSYNSRTCCGCESLERIRSHKIINLDGQIFGKLTAIKRMPVSKRGQFYLCRCECKKEVIIRVDALREGRAQSCGCMKMSIHEQIIYNILYNLNVDFGTQYSFDNCRYSRKNRLRFDFNVFNNGKLHLIEYHGKQHYESVICWGGEDTFKINNIRDKIKLDYCKDNNIPLLIM